MNKEDKNKETVKKVSASELLQKIKSHIPEESTADMLTDKRTADGALRADNDNAGGATDNAGESFANALLEMKEDKEDASQSGGEETPEDEKKRHAAFTSRESSRIKSAIDETEYDLMSIFGVERNDENNMMPESEDDASAQKQREADIDLSDKKKVKNFVKALRRRVYLSCLALSGTAVLFLITLVVENAGLVGLPLPSFLDLGAYPDVVLMLSLQVILLAVAMQYKQFFSHIRSFFTAKPSEGCVFALLALVLPVYYIVMFKSGVANVPMLNSVLLLAACASSAAEVLNALSCLYRLKTVSSGKAMKAVCLLQSDAENKLREKETVLRYMPEETLFMEVKCTDGNGIKGFAAGSLVQTGSRATVKLLVLLTLTACLAFTAVGIYRSGTKTGFTAGMIAAAVCAPITLSLAFSLPVYNSGKKLFKRGAAVIGESAADIYKSPACLLLNDTEIFTGKNGVVLKGLQSYGDAKIDIALGAAAAVFAKLNCPIGRIFASTASDYNLSSDADIVFVDENGIEGAVEGSSVYIGDYTYMKEKNLLPPKESRAYETDDCYTYIAVDNKTALRVQLEYTVNRDFVRTAEMLMKKGVNIIIKSSDPNINMELLEKLTGIRGEHPVRIMKGGEDGRGARGDKTEKTGVISSNGIYPLGEALVSCSGVKGAINTGIVFAWLSYIAGAGLLTAAVLTGIIGELYPLYIILYQLFWIIPTVAVSRT